MDHRPAGLRSPPHTNGCGAAEGADGGQPATTTMRSYAFDRMGSSAVVLDGDGTIVDTNEAWRLFTLLNEGSPSQAGVGADYLAVCDRSAANGSEVAVAVAQGIRQVLDGQRRAFDIEYPCPSPAEDRWFLMQASAAPISDGAGAVVSHVDITARKVLEAQLPAHADIDELTGLPNRQGALDHLADRLATGTDDLVLVVVGLDRFEHTIDDHGHRAGDEVLVKVASRLRRAVGGEGWLATAATGSWSSAAVNGGSRKVRPAWPRRSATPSCGPSRSVPR